MSTVLVFLWGLNWPAAVISLGIIPPMTFRFATLLLGSTILFLYCAISNRPMRPSSSDWYRLGVTALLNIVLWNMLSAYAIVTLNSARASIVAFTMPFWTLLLERALGTQMTARRKMVASVGAVGVLGLLVSAWADPTFSLDGLLIMLAAAFSWACGSVYMKHRPIGLPHEAVMAWALLLSAGMLAPTILLECELFNALQHMDFAQILAFLYAAVIGIAVCQVLWLRLLRMKGPTGSGLTLLGVPPVGVLSSMVLVGAPVSLLDTAALACLLLAGWMSLSQG